MKREIGPEDLIVYVMYVQSLLATVRRIIEFTEQFQKGMTGIERFAEIMSVESDIKDRKNAKEIKNVRGEISFKNVYFSYGEGGEKVLENFSVDITPGEKLAIVGPSGAGKTTICNLIPRFYDVDSGSVNVDGIDVRRTKTKNFYCKSFSKKSTNINFR